MTGVVAFDDLVIHDESTYNFESKFLNHKKLRICRIIQRTVQCGNWARVLALVLM